MRRAVLCGLQASSRRSHSFEAMTTTHAVFEVVEGSWARVVERSPPLRLLAACRVLPLLTAVGEGESGTTSVAVADGEEEVFQKLVVDVRPLRWLLALRRWLQTLLCGLVGGTHQGAPAILSV